jgi:murein DD-endopeptidase MepM/ murein hydrolase activator NlpD
VQGRIVSDFGPKPGGLHNDGINISAARGAPIHAAENGVVVYAGNELRGFGNLLLVRHADGWVTAYGHCDQLLVRRGQQVRRGQAIARVGSTGNVRTPQLHFEVRRGTRPVNPNEFLEQ